MKVTEELGNLLHEGFRADDCSVWLGPWLNGLFLLIESLQAIDVNIRNIVFFGLLDVSSCSDKNDLGKNRIKLLDLLWIILSPLELLSPPFFNRPQKFYIISALPLCMGLNILFAWGEGSGEVWWIQRNVYLSRGRSHEFRFVARRSQQSLFFSRVFLCHRPGWVTRRWFSSWNQSWFYYFF